MYNSWLIVVLRAFSVLLCFYSAWVYADTAAGRDPTKPIPASGEAATGAQKNEERSVTGFVLDAVLISGDDKFAIINNKIVKVGDTIGTSTVKTIDSYHVTLAGETGEIVLQLFGSPIKEPAK